MFDVSGDRVHLQSQTFQSADTQERPRHINDHDWDYEFADPEPSCRQVQLGP